MPLTCSYYTVFGYFLNTYSVFGRILRTIRPNTGYQIMKKYAHIFSTSFCKAFGEHWYFLVVRTILVNVICFLFIGDLQSCSGKMTNYTNIVVCREAENDGKIPDLVKYVFLSLNPIFRAVKLICWTNINQFQLMKTTSLFILLTCVHI